MKRFYIILWIIVALFTTQPLQAHLLWLNIDNYQPGKDENVRIEIGFGHQFPKVETIKDGFLNKVYALDSSGKEMSLTQISPTQFKFRPHKEGVYRILANIHPGFLSKTTEGYKLQPKKGLQEALSCFRYDIRAKAIVRVGSKGEKIDDSAGDPLEIIPLKNSDQLKEGDLFPLKVIYDGKPLSHANLLATYEGFSEQPNTFAYSTMTDKQGVANVKIMKKGNWLVNVTHKVPYPDPEECDEYSYKYSFTFEVK